MFALRLINSIDPEIAVHSANYERNFQLLTMAKKLLLLGLLTAAMGLWLLTCFFLLKSRKRSYGWLALAVFGPFGLIGLTMLGDDAPAPGDLHQRFVGKLNIFLRLAYEAGFFVIVWVAAYQLMVLKRDLMILRQAAATGVSPDQIIAQQNASSGMWAFGESLEVMFLVVLLYLLWPACFNVVGGLLRPKASSAVA